MRDLFLSFPSHGHLDPAKREKDLRLSSSVESAQSADSYAGGLLSPDFYLLTPDSHNSTRRSLSALVITDTELNVMAALARMGLKSRPMKG